MRAFRRFIRLDFLQQSSPSSSLRHRTASAPKPSQRASLTASVSASAILLAVPATMANSYSTTVTKRELGLDPVPDDAPSRPHHVKRRDGTPSAFQNVHPSAGDGWFDFLPFMRKMVSAVMGGELGSPDAAKIAKTIGVQKPTFLPDRTSSSKLRATWLGHACYYVEYPSGLRVLFDPVFEDRCSPFSFMGPKRHTPRPCDIADLPFVDAVVISHSHYDHLSNPTVRELANRHPETHFFVGLGLETWFRSSGINNVTELDWWETADMTLTPKSQSEGGKKDGVDSVKSGGDESITARVSCLPAQHCSSRRPGDYNTTLWCSWAVSSSSPSSPESRSVYFGGDTGYRHVPRVPAVEATDETRNPAADFEPPYDTLPVCPQFAQIGELRGPFDLGFLPIGAYKPRYLFSHMHANPFDSVDIFRDTKCKRAMGIHWGTWTLTSEELDEPPKLLKMALKRKGMPETGVFDVCDIGESREF